ncbi:MAG: hypothetical protein JXR46_01895 [Calditrichaceae bacterium]|nr:hypothetical protein [Calditrichaceae bacterium]MBN2707772.1 hypothetical protein [Calditrichaceae bacterium]RQV96406.1 MAG: hypothetical protein EH224_04755 [Calditrichota bacterium]
MTENTVDLKKLILLINANKEINANLNLDEGCTFEAEDHKPLIKVINYFINYMETISSMPMEVSLELRGDQYVLIFLSYTDKSDLPPLSDKLSDALSMYKAKYVAVHEKGKYYQIKVTFQK